MSSIDSYIGLNQMYMFLRKYKSSRNFLHEKRVLKYSTQIFDFLSNSYNLSREDRALLRYSALLHDVGRFINKKNHDKHTYHIVFNDSSLGMLPKKKRSMLAVIAGSHRKSVHQGINNHSKKERKKLLRLISIIRIADAIDCTRHPFVKIYNMRWNNDNLKLVINGMDLDKLFKRVNKKAPLFEETYKTNIILTHPGFYYNT